MPLGLTNAPENFNRLMDDSFREVLDQFVLVLDEKQHNYHLHTCRAVADVRVWVGPSRPLSRRWRQDKGFYRLRE